MVFLWIKLKSSAISIEYLTQQINLAQHKRFGSSSEKDPYTDGYEQAAFCFNEAGAISKTDAVEPEYEDIVPRSYRRRKSKGKREADFSDLPVVQ